MLIIHAGYGVLVKSQMQRKLYPNVFEGKCAFLCPPSFLSRPSTVDSQHCLPNLLLDIFITASMAGVCRDGRHI